MRIEWDEKKSELNRIARGRGFEEAAALFSNLYFARKSTRNGRRRWEIWGYIDGKEWLGVFEFMYDETLRVVSLRRANKKEIGRFYVQES